jgi:hypothetical protein
MGCNGWPERRQQLIELAAFWFSVSLFFLSI